MAALTHPNVINVYDYGHVPPAGGGGAYLVMSYVDGKPLSRHIAEAGRPSVAATASEPGPVRRPPPAVPRAIAAAACG